MVANTEVPVRAGQFLNNCCMTPQLAYGYPYTLSYTDLSANNLLLR
jgi:hypothetical protein